MKAFAVSEAKNRFGMLLRETQHSPVRITEEDRPVAVLLAAKAYETFSLYEQRRQKARKRAIEILSKPVPNEFASLSEDELLEMVNQEIDDCRAGK